MGSIKLYWGFVCSFIAFGLIAILLNQEPLCIHSKLVERIDKYSPDQKKETVYQCRQGKPAENPRFFIEKLSALEKRVQSVEHFLEVLGLTTTKLSISIVTHKPLFFVQQDHQLWIGEKLLDSPNHLEKALLKHWIRTHWPVYFAQQDLADEVLSDFLLFVMKGKLHWGDPLKQKELKSELANWPQVIKSVRGYCDSPWRLSEHFEFCQQNKIKVATLSSDSLELGLRPLLSESMVSAYKSLTFREQRSVLLGFRDFIRLPRKPAPKLIRREFVEQAGQGRESALNTVKEASDAIKDFSDFFAHAETVKTRPEYRSFATLFADEILQRGFQWSFRDLHFDLIFNSEIPISEKIISHFQKIQISNPEFKMALTDSQHVWIMPQASPLPKSSFGKLTADRGVFEKCTGMNFKETLSLAESFQRVLVVGNCRSEAPRSYEGFVKRGAEGFALQNPTLSFVQLHLPSLVIRKEEIAEAPDLFKSLEKTDELNPVVQALGWQEIRWNKQMNAYSPRAHLDGIEWFRRSSEKPN